MVRNEQLRAARALLGWSQTELAVRPVCLSQPLSAWKEDFGPHVSDEARAKLKKAIEAGGVEFIEENGGGAGVRFRKAKKA